MKRYLLMPLFLGVLPVLLAGCSQLGVSKMTESILGDSKGQADYSLVDEEAVFYDKFDKDGKKIGQGVEVIKDTVNIFNTKDNTGVHAEMIIDYFDKEGNKTATKTVTLDQDEANASGPMSTLNKNADNMGKMLDLMNANVPSATPP